MDKASHEVPTGAPLQITEQTPTLFLPLTIRSKTLRNRICVSPMCLYSTPSSGANLGALPSLYMATIGHFVFKGAAMAMIEATGVQPGARISPKCPGLWNDAQEDALRSLASFIHTVGGICGVQLSHGGRKSSVQPPLVADKAGLPSVRAYTEDDGWPHDVVGPSGGIDQIWDGKLPEDPTGGFHVPRAMTVEEIRELVADFGKSAQRAVRAGADLVSIHGAHGYLLHQFLSPITNRRTDEYGGSFERRTRLLIEVIKSVRAVMPDTMPLVLRISATDWMEETALGQELGSWDERSTIRLAMMLPELGVDLLDVSSGGNHREARYNVFTAGERQAEIASRYLLAGNFSVTQTSFSIPPGIWESTSSGQNRRGERSLHSENLRRDSGEQRPG
ncbi:putative NADPH dehydrogenase C23G7.10c [Cercospora zeina]